MNDIPILYQDFVDGLRNILQPATTTDDPSCSICSTDYGLPGPGVQTNLDYLNELAEPLCQSFVQHVVEPVVTPCGHNFCTFCICVWLLGDAYPTCPMCRTEIDVPLVLRQWVYMASLDPVPPVVNVLSRTHSLSTRKAQEIFDVLQMSMRKLLTAPRPEKFTWNTKAMINDLPKIMITVARRFFFRSKNLAMPEDRPSLRLHNPMDRLTGSRLVDAQKDLEKLLKNNSRDAPLADHPDGRRLYELLCERIRDLDEFLDGRFGVAQDSYTQRKALSQLVWEDMPFADGGVGREKWWAYVQCVINALICRQGYCRYVVMLTTGDVTVVFDEARAAEGVAALTIV
jgi:hypothetical protein